VWNATEASWVKWVHAFRFTMMLAGAALITGHFIRPFNVIGFVFGVLAIVIVFATHFLPRS
jgi:hypothetical protein